MLCPGPLVTKRKGESKVAFIKSMTGMVHTADSVGIMKIATPHREVSGSVITIRKSTKGESGSHIIHTKQIIVFASAIKLIRSTYSQCAIQEIMPIIHICGEARHALMQIGEIIVTASYRK